MVFGRLLGWLLVAASMLLASGDAVLALGPGDHESIAAGEVVTLLSGLPLAEGGALSARLLQLPAWLVMAPLGAGLCWTCRRRRRRFRFRPV